MLGLGRGLLGLAWGIVCVAPTVLLAEEPAPAKITYDEHVQPILREHCFTCHSQDTAKSDLALDSYAATMRGGASGEVVFAGDTGSSRLWMLVSHQETPEMPPKQDKLAAEKLGLIERWIAEGALENSGSKARIKKKPKLEMVVAASGARPEGPPPMPEGLSREPALVTPRTGAITALACSPWAPVVAVAGVQQIVLYHTGTGELLGVLPFPEGTAHVLKFSRSGGVLLAGGGRAGQSGKVVLFDIRDGRRVAELGDELDTVLAADINDDHTRVALGGPRRVVRVYSVDDGSLLGEIKKHTDWIYALEFSPDGALLATGDRGSGLFVWEAETLREYQNLRGHAAAIHDVSWRADGNALASASDDGTVRLWEMENGTEVKNWQAHAGGAASVEFARDGRLATCGRDRAAKLWAGDGAPQQAFEAFGDLALEVAVSHDGGRVLAGDWTGEVRMWNAADAARVAVLRPNPPTLAEAARRAQEALAAAQAGFSSAEAARSAAEAAHAGAVSAVTVAEQALAAAVLAKTTAEQQATERRAAEAQAKALLQAAEAALATEQARSATDSAATSTAPQ